jgi:NAD(P)-dependent dehydrogenase (short-subunit alcohol dehydrogenase family)
MSEAHQRHDASVSQPRASVFSPAAIVTGGAGEGIGHGITEALVEEGWHVLIVDRDADATDLLQKRFLRENKRVEILVADVTLTSTPALAVDLAMQAFGRIDGLVNSAGIGLCKPIAGATDEEFDRLLDVDLRAALRFCRAVIPAMPHEGGSIVNIGSVHAHKSIAGYGLYGSVKSALEGLTRGIAIDYGHKSIRANAVHPGYVESPQNRELISRFAKDPEAWLQRYAVTKQLIPAIISARQVGDLVAFLLGPKSAAITGQSLVIDAGSSVMLYEREELQ